MINFLLEAWRTYMWPYMLPEFCISTDVGFVPCFPASSPIVPQATLDDRTVFGLPNIYFRIQLVQPKLFLYPSDADAMDRVRLKIISFFPFLRQVPQQAGPAPIFIPPQI